MAHINSFSSKLGLEKMRDLKLSLTWLERVSWSPHPPNYRSTSSILHIGHRARPRVRLTLQLDFLHNGQDS